MPEINTKLNLNDRETIQISIVNKQPIKRIAKLLNYQINTRWGGKSFKNGKMK